MALIKIEHGLDRYYVIYELITLIYIFFMFIETYLFIVIPMWYL